jgi:hypothetical protein
MPDVRHFPPPWSVDDPDIKLGQDCFIVRDHDGKARVYVYFDDQPRKMVACRWRSC